MPEGEVGVAWQTGGLKGRTLRFMSESSTTSTCRRGGSGCRRESEAPRRLGGSGCRPNGVACTTDASGAAGAAGVGGWVPGAPWRRGVVGGRCGPVGPKSVEKLGTLPSHRAISGGSRDRSRTGISTKKVQPWPSPALSHQILPPTCCSTMPWEGEGAKRGRGRGAWADDTHGGGGGK